MGLKLRRRSVYIGTIVALVAMIGGFALATAVSGITFGPGTGNQNSGSINTGNTIYATTTATVTLASGDGLAGGCSLTAAYAADVANIAVVGSGATCPATNEWYDELTFTGVNVPAGASNTFWIGVNGGAAAAGFTITSSTAQTPSTLNIYIDDGPTSGAPQITSIAVTVSGS